MGYANSSETELAFVEESTWGVTPASPTFKRARMTGEGLVYDIETVTSDEVQPNADVTDEVQVGASASGPINFELSFGDAFGVLMAHALRGTWQTGTPGDDLEELKAGIERKSLTIEKRFALDSGAAYSRFSGMVANSLQLTVEQAAIVTGSIEFVGKGETTGSTPLSGATYEAADSGRPMAAPDVANIMVGGVGGSIFYSSLSFTVSNNCETQGAIGVIDAVGVRYGRREIEGNLSAYFDASTVALYDRFVNGAESSLSFDLNDDQGNTYTLTFPRIRFTTGRRVAGGNGEDVIAEMGFRALLDPVEGCAVKITRTALGA